MKSFFRMFIKKNKSNKNPIGNTKIEVYSHLEIENKEVPVDMYGFLINSDDWNQKVALKQADLCEIELSDDHWLVINYIREKHENSSYIPEVKHLLKYMRKELGEKRSTSKYLDQLFPYGYAIYACRIAGMSTPLKMI